MTTLDKLSTLEAMNEIRHYGTWELGDERLFKQIFTPIEPVQKQ